MRGMLVIAWNCYAKSLSWMTNAKRNYKWQFKVFLNVQIICFRVVYIIMPIMILAKCNSIEWRCFFTTGGVYIMKNINKHRCYGQSYHQTNCLRFWGYKIPWQWEEIRVTCSYIKLRIVRNRLNSLGGKNFNTLCNMILNIL